MRALHLRYPRRRWVVVSAVVVLLAAGGAVWWARSADSSSANDPTYRLVAASTGTIRQSISSTGTIAPAQQDAVNFTVSGKVTRVAATAGQRVSAGTVLATIDTATLTANLAQAQATLATAQAKVAADNADSSTTSTQLAADTAAATSAQGQVTSAQQAMSAATLTSPIAGVVAEVNLTVGQQVGGSSSGSGSGTGGSGSGTGGSGGGTGGSGSGAGGSGSGGSNSSSSSSTDQFLVISTTSWVVNATVDSTGVGLIANGDQAQIVPGSSPSVAYGTISSVGVMATTSSGVATFPVVISVTGNPPGLHAGDTATVSLIYKQLSDVLIVPTAAVHTVNGQRVVYLVSGGKQVSHPVQVGLSSGGSTQITSGLNEGDQVEVAIPSTSNGGAGSSASRSARPSGGTRQFPGGGNFGGGGFGGGGGGFGGGGGGNVGGGAPGTGGG
jgi:multidrug efflux pump subunit AcrA (membrane-fusion protein)